MATSNSLINSSIRANNIQLDHRLIIMTDNLTILLTKRKIIIGKIKMKIMMISLINIKMTNTKLIGILMTGHKHPLNPSIIKMTIRKENMKGDRKKPIITLIKITIMIIGLS